MGESFTIVLFWANRDGQITASESCLKNISLYTAVKSAANVRSCNNSEVLFSFSSFRKIFKTLCKKIEITTGTKETSNAQLEG